ncbi:hypothetical protein Vadar_018662 [Vaccinium darrowii]|uniref:Uncharacterized protein n=1 Tax=Vaccinium darrowii TaxID=229202 RepID=A0ACB7XIC6_9ERIC|nr:hypothetical protein Vadar_018662 [Vaccinium darrowii]
MGIPSILSLFFLLHLLFPHSSGKCPDSFNCGTHGQIKFPLSNTTFPQCGIFTVQNCPDPVPKLNLGTPGVLYDLNSTNVQENSVRVNDPYLRNLIRTNVCDIFSSYLNWTLPVRPSISFTISPGITLFKCITISPELDKQQDRYFHGNDSYRGCSGYTVYYKYPHYYPVQSNGSIPPNCSVMELPVVSERRNRNASDLFSVLASEFSIEFHVSNACRDCRGKGGRCDHDGPLFLCKKEKEDSFNCGTHGQIRFPLSNTTFPQCGLFTVKTCTDPVPKLNLGKPELFYDLSSTNVEENSCSTISPELDKQQDSYFHSNDNYRGCSGYTVYYKYPHHYPVQSLRFLKGSSRLCCPRRFRISLVIAVSSSSPLVHEQISMDRSYSNNGDWIPVADVAILKANGMWLKDRKLFVKFASFGKKDVINDRRIKISRNHGLESGDGLSCGIRNRSQSHHNRVDFTKTAGKGVQFLRKNIGVGSYAEGLTGHKERKLATKSIQCHSIGNGWLFRSAIAKVQKLLSANDLVDENTLNGGSYEKGRILIATDQSQKIEGNIGLVVDGTRYMVRIEEEDFFRKVESSNFFAVINSMSIHEDQLLQVPKEAQSLVKDLEEDPIHSSSKFSQGLESFVIEPSISFP